MRVHDHTADNIDSMLSHVFNQDEGIYLEEGCNGEQSQDALNVDTCFTSTLVEPVTFSISMLTMYAWSDDALGRAEVEMLRMGLTSYRRVTRVEWNGASGASRKTNNMQRSCSP